MTAAQRRKKSFFISAGRHSATIAKEKSVPETMRGDWRRIERAGEIMLNLANGGYSPQTR